MADINGSNGNDILFFQGGIQHLTLTIVNPYTGESFFIDDDYNTNLMSYDGLLGSDTLFMTNLGDALFIRNPVTGARMIDNVEIFFAGDGGDVIALADTNYILGNIVVDGGAANDLILANSGNDTLSGRQGDDIIDGGPGDDTINGGANSTQASGNDTLNGGSGADLLRGDDGDDTLIYYADGVHDGSFLAWNVGSPGVPGTETIVNPAGKNASYDIFNGGTGYDTLVMTDGDDVLFLDDLFNPHNASGTSLRLIGVERIEAGAGDDIVDLTHDTLTYGAVEIYGGDGNDFLWSSAGDDYIDGGAGHDHIYGGFGADELDGGDGNDEIYGSLGNDILRGGAGNDILYGGAGSLSDYVTITEQSHDFTSDVVFPNLTERVNILDLVPPGDNALGIAAGDLSVEYSTTATVSFLRTEAGYNNSLGFYNILLDGTIQSADLAFSNVKNYAAGAQAVIDLPGAPDTDFGFFVIADGARKNNFGALDLEHGTLQFIYKNGTGAERLATIYDNASDISLVLTDGNGEHVLKGAIYHSTIRDGATNLNPDGQVHVVSGIMDGTDGGTLRIGFEDLPSLGDADYNDVVFDLTVASQTTYTLLEDDGDILLGGAGDDVLNGGIGDDLLVGGDGADLLFGDQGADVFLFQSIADAGDTILDFETGAGGDAINLTDVLVGYDAGSSNANDFMRLVDSGGDSLLQVDTDGAGGDFVTLAVIQGGTDGMGIAALLEAGNLVADQSVIV